MKEQTKEVENPWSVNLVLAAPDLLRACKFALEWINEIKKLHPEAVHSKGWGMIELEQAINKAEGK